MTPHDDRIRLEDAELTGERFAPGPADLRLLDVVLRDCDLSNVAADGGALVRVRAERTRLVGFTLEEGELRESVLSDCALSLASFARATLRGVHFLRCDLREASFLGARLHGVTFTDCELAEADLRDAQVAETAIRGSSLESVLGVEALRGVRMPWDDVVASAGAFAAALGVEVEQDERRT